MSTRSAATLAFGDFQTPPALAAEVCGLLENLGVSPRSVLEPTCGTGGFLAAAAGRFPGAARLVGVDVNPAHLAAARAAVRGRGASLVRADFFRTDWRSLVAPLPGPLLVIGNPPWATSAGLGALGSANLPDKSNFQHRLGLDARTGKSNFDISEWMVIRLLEALGRRDGVLAMLVKTAVARRVLAHCWASGLAVRAARLHRIDARAHFGTGAAAGLLVCTTGGRPGAADCSVFEDLTDGTPTSTFGLREGKLVADVALYERCGHLPRAGGPTWRSGVKHDCAKVMELRERGGALENGLGERPDLEADYLYPMLKSSELAAAPGRRPVRWMLVTQRAIGDDTGVIRTRAPRTWAYLERHADRLDRRASSVYRHRPRFSVFGVGAYSFAPWKVAISGLYKRLDFRVVGPHRGQPVVLDDTAYFVPCRSRAAARRLAALLASDPAQAFYRAFIFWDTKRPITKEILSRLDPGALARAPGPGGEAGSSRRSKARLRRPAG